MDEKQKIEWLENQVARLDARVNALQITLISLLSGEISAELLQEMKERLIAVALATTAPDSYAEALTSAFDRLSGALQQSRGKQSPIH